LLKLYNGRNAELISAVFSEYAWLPWKFATFNFRLWSDINIQKMFIDSVAQELSIKDLDDWYNVKPEVRIYK
jgi:hypothetical protein